MARTKQTARKASGGMDDPWELKKRYAKNAMRNHSRCRGRGCLQCDPHRHGRGILHMKCESGIQVLLQQKRGL